MGNAVGKGGAISIMQYSKGNGEPLVVLRSEGCFKQEWAWVEEVRGYHRQWVTIPWTREAVGMEVRVRI